MAFHWDQSREDGSYEKSMLVDMRSRQPSCIPLESSENRKYDKKRTLSLCGDEATGSSDITYRYPLERVRV
jgi:hypothetical protein